MVRSLLQLSDMNLSYLVVFLVLQEYLVLTERRIPLMLVLVLGGVRIVAVSISSHEQIQ